MSFNLDGNTIGVIGPESGVGQFSGDGGARVKMVYTCEWSAYYDVVAALLGYPPGPTFIGTPREPHELTTPPGLKCMNIDAQGIGTPTAVAGRADVQFLKAKIVAYYGPQPWHAAGFFSQNLYYQGLPPFATVRGDYQMHMLAGGSGRYTWPDDTVIDTPVAVPDPRRDIVVRLHRVRSFDRSVIDLAYGAANDAVWLGNPIGTVLFYGFSEERDIGTAFQPTAVTLKMMKHRHGWNKKYRPGADPLWQDISPPPVELTNFTTLFNTFVV